MKVLLQYFSALCKKYIYQICFALIILSSLSVMLCNFDPALRETGEARHYALSTYTLLSKGSISFNRSDIETGKRILGSFDNKFPRYSYKEKSFLHRFATAPAADKDFVGRSYYWGTYSALCIPAFWFFRAFHISSSNLYNAFKITNILMLLIPLFVIIFQLKADNRMKLCLLLAFAIPPAQQYVNWASAEVCIYMFTLLSLLYLFNKQYIVSAVMLSLAATLNCTLFPLAVVIFIAMTVDNAETLLAQGTPWKKIVPCLLKKTFFFVCCFIPVFYAVLTTFLQYSSIVTMENMKEYSYLFHRFAVYLFDPNLSFLVYYNIFFLLFLGLTVWFVIKREYILFSLSAAFFLIVLGFSLIHHINCGMEGISRYGAWSGAIIIFTAVVGFDKTVRLKKSLLIFTIIFFFISLYLALFPLGKSYVHWNSISEFIFTHCPRLYKPLYSTFISRTRHVDGGNYTGPLSLEAGQNRILLFRKGDLQYLWTLFAAQTPEAAKALDNQKNAILSSGTKDSEYVYLYAKAKDIFPRSDQHQIVIARDRALFSLHSGFSTIESWGVWTDGKLAHAQFKIPDHWRGQDIILSLNACSYGKKGTPQTVILKSNGHYLATFRFDKHAELMMFQTRIPGKLTCKELLSLEFHITSPRSPASLSAGQDRRQLGIGLEKVIFSPSK
ncbi:MAG: hypothetical protein IKB99_06785 [Lentisphaeria bacterium]|nr:hypothetical protein [Lentisphaeria bacterium]